MKTQKTLVTKARALSYELRALITFAKINKKYVNLLRLFDRFNY